MGWPPWLRCVGFGTAICCTDNVFSGVCYDKNQLLQYIKMSTYGHVGTLHPARGVVFGEFGPVLRGLAICCIYVSNRNELSIETEEILIAAAIRCRNEGKMAK
jgi:hypothetical protein